MGCPIYVMQGSILVVVANLSISCFWPEVEHHRTDVSELSYLICLPPSLLTSLTYLTYFNPRYLLPFSNAGQMMTGTDKISLYFIGTHWKVSLITRPLHIAMTFR